MVAAVKLGSRLDGLARNRRELDRLEAEWVFRVGDYGRSFEWQAAGYLSAAAAIAKRCHMNAGAARATVQLARTLERLPATTKAFEAGEISRQHASVMADGYTEERAEQLAKIEAGLVDIGRGLDPKSFRTVVRQYTDAIDGDGGADADEREIDRNRVHLSVLSGRGVVDGSLDLESTEIVKTAVAAMRAKLRKDGDERRGSQRDAEALVEICRRSLATDHAKSPKRRRARPHLSAIYDVRNYEADHPDVVAEMRAEAEHVGYLSRATLERWACDCEISRIIIDGPGQIIDVGRATRTVPDKLWRALVARDRHCTAAGCERPPGGCEAHHVWHWEHGGPTNLDNLVLLCWHHHRQQHIHDAQARGSTQHE
jgi:Domain of unknown function (DUF222)/HNH endonuclease